MRLLLVVFALVLGCPPPPVTLSSAGATITFSSDGTFQLARPGKPLLAFDRSAFQVGTVRELDASKSYDPYWLVVEDPVLTKVEPPSFKWRALINATVTQASSDEVRLDATFDADVTATITVRTAAHGFTLRFVPNVEARPVAMLRVRARAGSTEGFYGLGEWFDGPNHRGKIRPMQIEPDLSVESATTENHVVTPLLLGTNGWGLFVETKRFGVFTIAKDEADLIDSMWGTAEASADGLTAHLFTADAPLDLLAPYQQLTGAPRLPAPWGYGPLIWRNESRDQAEVLDDVATLRRLDLATSGVWIDRPYATAVNTFDFDQRLFPDAGEMISTAQAAGLRVAVWHTPYLETSASPYRAEAEREGYFPPMQGLLINRWSAPLDFTNARADAFWRARLAAYRSLGIEGYKLDFAEDIAAGIAGNRSGWQFSDGSTEKTMHVDYTRLYHRAYRASLGPLDGFLLARAGRWGSQTDGLVIWPGDIDATLTRFQEPFTDRGGKRVVGIGGLPSAVRAGQSLSMSGFPFFGADTGGYRHSPPNKETFMRWVSQSALSTCMQTGDSSSQPPWVFTAENGRDDEAVAHYRTFARLHLRLFPYVWTFAAQLATTGRPIQRPFGVQFPELGVHPADQYLLGDALLVAPIETAGVTSRTVIHPPGGWSSWFDGTVLAGEPGEAVSVSASLGQLPLFVRDGALVPMLRPTIDTLSPASDGSTDSFANSPGDLWVHVVPSNTKTSFTVFDGTVVTQERTAEAVVFTSTKGTTFTSAAVFEFFAPRPSSVTVDGISVSFVSDLGGVPRGASWENGIVRVKAALGSTVEIR